MKSFVVFMLLLSFFHRNYAQNFVRNGSFEDHRYLDCQSCHLAPDNFTAIMRDWRNLIGSNSFICDCNYRRNQSEVDYGICPIDQIKPYDGCTMMQMEYMPSCLDFDHNTQGCASYVSSKLSAPLEIGKTYEVSFWINIRQPEDIDYVRHIGCMLYPEAIQNSRGQMLSGSPFLIDRFIYGSWYQVKWVVRPICNLQFLVIGVFRDLEGPPVHRRPNRNIYFIDQVAVQEVASTDAQDAIVPFCKYENKPNPYLEEVEGTTCYFNFGDSILLPEYQVLLDTFAERLQKKPEAAFIISGHTDSIGSDNLALSSKRIAQVLQYLEERHRIPKLRFISVPAGSRQPASSNDKEAGRRLNRRVEIKQVICSVSMVVYRNALLYVFENQIEEAFKALRIWLSMANDEHKMLLLFDPRMDGLKKDKRWLQLEREIRQSYKKYEKPDLAYLLDSLWAEDQKYRTLQYHIENMAAYFAEMDSTESRWDVVFPALPDSMLIERERFAGQRLLKLIDQNGWPGISQYGKRPAKSAFLIINHTMDTTVLAKYLPMLESQCKIGEAEWLFYATMYDRLQTIKGLPQRFGTQYKVINEAKNQYELFPLEDPVNVNKLRKMLGLADLEGY